MPDIEKDQQTRQLFAFDGICERLHLPNDFDNSSGGN